MRRRKAFCKTAHGDVFYWHVGEGAPLVMLHQAAQCSEEFRECAEILAANYQVIGLDYPGHGASDDPSDELGTDEFSAAVIAVLNTLQIGTAHVCGHHSGALLAINLAANFAARVSSVVMSGIGICTDESVKTFLETPMTRDLPIDAKGQYLQSTWNVYRRMSAPDTPPEVIFGSFLRGLQARTRPFDAHYAMMLWDRDEFLEHISQPALLICGEHDDFAEHPDQLAAKIPRCKFEWISGGGAFLFQEQPAACAAAIRKFIETQR